MGESFIQVPPNGSGLRMRTRQRTVSGNAVEESYMRYPPDSTYAAVGRIAAVNARGSLSFAQTANTDKQWLTLHHAASSTKLVRIMYVGFMLVDTSAASVMNFDVRHITSAPATGNPAVTPTPHNRGNAATECTALALPTTAGTTTTTESLAYQEFDAGIMAATTSLGANQGRIDLYTNDRVSDESQALELRPGVLEGIAIIVRTVGGITVNGIPIIRYTEEVA